MNKLPPRMRLALRETQDPEKRFAGLPLLLEYVDGRLYRLARDTSYRIAGGNFEGDVSTVRLGFLFDFASIPRLLWPIAPPAGDGSNLYGLAALWHDWCYKHGQIQGLACTRKDVDNLFLEIMLYLGVQKWKAYVMWAAVRGGAWMTWNRYRRQETEGSEQSTVNSEQ